MAKDAKYSDMREPAPPVMYLAFRQTPRQSQMNVYVRTAIEPAQVAPALRQAVAALDPDLPIRHLRTMREQIDMNVANERLLSVLTGSFAGLATLLAAIGLYGVLAYNVARRTREIGIRMALGANAGDVRRLVVRDTSVMLGIGMLAGLGSAAAVSRLVQSALYGVTALDPVVYASAAGLMTAIALAATYLPARRATGVDPLVALRYE